MSAEISIKPQAAPVVLAKWMIGIVFGAFSLLLVGLALGVRGPDISMLLWAIATFVFCAIPVAIDSARKPAARHILFSVISIGFALRFALPVLTYYIPAQGPIDSPDLPHSNLMPPDISYAQALLLMGFVLFTIGYAIPIGRGLSRILPQPKFDWNKNAAMISALGLIGFGWALFLAGEFGFVPDRLGSGLIGGFSDATLYGPAILAIAYIRDRSIASAALIAILVPITSFFNFFTGIKRLVLTPPAIVGLAWIVHERRIHKRWFVLAFLAILLLYPSAQFYREVILDDNTRTLADVMRNPGPAISSLGEFASSTRGIEYLSEGLEATGVRMDGVGHAAVIIRDTPSIVPFQGGWTVALIPITFIPRAIWPEKPVITIGAWIIDNYRVVGWTINSSIGPTWVGELYLNFGVWGIPPGMFLLGILLRFAHESLVRRAATSLTIVIETILILQLSIKLTGSLADLITRPIMTIIPLVGLHFFIRAIGGAYRIDQSSQKEAIGESARDPAFRNETAAV